MRNKIRYILISFFTISVIIFASCDKPASTSTEQNKKEIVSFVFRVINNPSLPADINGVINNDLISITVPFGTNVSSLVPTITINGKSISPLSDIKQDFNKPVLYTLSAEDNSTKTYTIIVKVGDTEGTLYINSTYPNPPGFGKLYAIDANTGGLKWKFTLSVNGDESSPTFYDGMIFTAMGKGIIALDPMTQSIKWDFPTEYNQTSVAVANAIVYANGIDQYLYAINALSGTQQWKYKYGDDQHAITGCSPTYANGVVYIGDGNGYVSAINATTGNLIWKVSDPNSWGSGISSNPAVVNGILYIANYLGNVYAINIDDGGYKWIFGPTQQIVSSPTVDNGIVYIGSTDKNLYAIDANTGILKWKYYAGQTIEGSPIVSNGIVYVGTTSGNRGFFYAIDAANGTLKWSFMNDRDFYSSPVVFNKTVYAASYATVFAFEADTGVLKWKFNTDDQLEEVRSSPCIVDKQGNVYNSGISGNQN